MIQPPKEKGSTGTRLDDNPKEKGKAYKVEVNIEH